MMKRNLDRIRRAVASILYYVKDREINWKELSVQGVVSSVVKAMEDRAGHLGVTMEIQVEDGTFDGDEFAVNSVLVNVVDYALEVCQRAQKETTAALVGSARVSEGWAIFDLRAEGFSMEEESRQLALATCYAPRGVDRSHLPLFIANRILRNHQGTLEITVSTDPPSTRLLIKVPSSRAAG